MGKDVGGSSYGVSCTEENQGKRHNQYNCYKCQDLNPGSSKYVAGQNTLDVQYSVC